MITEFAFQFLQPFLKPPSDWKEPGRSTFADTHIYGYGQILKSGYIRQH